MANLAALALEEPKGRSHLTLSPCVRSELQCNLIWYQRMLLFTIAVFDSLHVVRGSNELLELLQYAPNEL